MAKRSSFGSIVRKRLSDITNSQPKIDDQEDCLMPISPLAKNCIDKLVKEKATLVRLIKDRNKLIELSGVEIKKLKIYVQKMQVQNWNLAQSNSHMLAELNVGKEKIKALQHEITCKDAVLKSKNLTMEIACKDAVLKSKHLKTEIACKDVMLKSKNFSLVDADLEKSLPKADDDKKTGNANIRQPARSRSMASSTTAQQIAEKERAETKRLPSRRQSARFNTQNDCEVSEELFEIEDTNLTVSLESPTRADGSRKSLSGRPSRRVADKVKSYKEPPRNIKMRRTE